VLSRPAHPYTAGLLRSRITLGSARLHTLSTLPGEPPDLRDPPPGCPFAARCKFRIDECTDAMPPLQPVAAHPQLAACIRADELGDELMEAEIGPPLSRNGAGIASEEGTILRLRDVHKSYKLRGAGRKARLPALRGLDLDVRPQECVALVGESGCGKSTRLRVISGLLSADQGSVELEAEGRPQMVFQDAG